MKMKEISIALMEIFESVEMMEQLLSKISTEEKRVLFSVYAPTRCKIRFYSLDTGKRFVLGTVLAGNELWQHNSLGGDIPITPLHLSTSLANSGRYEYAFLLEECQ